MNTFATLICDRFDRFDPILQWIGLMEKSSRKSFVNLESDNKKHQKDLGFFKVSTTSSHVKLVTAQALIGGTQGCSGKQPKSSGASKHSLAASNLATETLVRLPK